MLFVKTFSHRILDIDSGRGSAWLGKDRFMAPELISGWEYDEGVDIWSIGITTVIMLTKQCPTTNPSTLLEKSKLDALIDWCRDVVFI